MTARKRRLPRHPNRPLRIAQSLERAAERFAASGASEEPKSLAKAGFAPADVVWLSGGLAIHPTPREIAWHESGHAVIAAAFGVEIARVTIERQPATRFDTGAIYSDYIGDLIMHGGPVAERLARGLIYRPADAELLPWIAMGDNRWFANHDYARLFARSAIDYPKWDEATRIAHFRRYETLAIELLTRRPFRAAVAAVADAALERGTIDGALIAGIVGQHITEKELDDV